MAFLVSGTLRVAAQMADAQDTLRRKGKYSLLGPRVGLILSSPEIPASIVTVLEGVFQTLGFESCQRREASVQDFLGELTGFREQLDAHGGPIGCALVALVAPSGQLRQPQQLIRELRCCGALQGCPKIFLLLSSAPGAIVQLGAFLTSLGELCGRCPHWSLLQLLTEVFCRMAEEPSGATYCPVLQSSLRGALCLGDKGPWRPEPEPTPSAQYDLSGAKAALILAVIRDRPGAQHDLKALGDLCQTLGFETTLRIDPTAQAFQEELAQFRKQLDTHRGPVSCALVSLMAHGGPQGQLLGADGQEVQPEVLMQELKCCRALQGHSKIFLLQACRGGYRDAGMGPIALPWFWRWLQTPPAVPSHADILQIYAGAQDLGRPRGLVESQDTGQVELIPLAGSSAKGSSPEHSDQEDILTVYSATEGCVAYRDEKGSDFIQTLVEVLRTDPGGDLLELLTEVNRQVCELDVLGPDCDEYRKACLEIHSSLRRRLCLQA